MKKLSLFILLLCLTYFVEAQHAILLTNNTLEDVTVELTFVEDDPSCTGVTSTLVVFVPQSGGPSITAVGAPTGPVMVGTPMLPGAFDNVLVMVRVLTSGGVPVIASTPAITLNGGYNILGTPCFPPMGPLSYTSAISGAYLPTWTYAPIIPFAFTSRGNTVFLDEITFF